MAALSSRQVTIQPNTTATRSTVRTAARSQRRPPLPFSQKLTAWIPLRMSVLSILPKGSPPASSPILARTPWSGILPRYRRHRFCRRAFRAAPPSSTRRSTAQAFPACRAAFARTVLRTSLSRRSRRSRTEIFQRAPTPTRRSARRSPSDCVWRRKRAASCCSPRTRTATASARR